MVSDNCGRQTIKKHMSRVREFLQSWISNRGRHGYVGTSKNMFESPVILPVIRTSYRDWVKSAVPNPQSYSWSRSLSSFSGILYLANSNTLISPALRTPFVYRDTVFFMMRISEHQPFFFPVFEFIIYLAGVIRISIWICRINSRLLHSIRRHGVYVTPTAPVFGPLILNLRNYILYIWAFSWNIYSLPRTGQTPWYLPLLP